VKAYSASCHICGKEKSYKTLQGLTKCKDKPCLSCANSIKLGGKGNKSSPDGLFGCAACGGRKSRDNFMNRADGRPYSYCKPCQSIQNKTNFKKKWRYEQYGISGDDFLKILNKQENKCCGCNSELISSNTKPHIDHCHKTGKVRGLLCKSCNSALGFAKDKVETLLNLANYLEKNK
jgi:hypothetical protein